MNITRVIAVLAALSCSAAFAVRDPSISIDELKKQRTELQRKISLNSQQFKKSAVSLSEKQRLLEEQKSFQQQDVELMRSISLSERVRSQDSVMYANE